MFYSISSYKIFPCVLLTRKGAGEERARLVRVRRSGKLAVTKRVIRYTWEEGVSSWVSAEYCNFQINCKWKLLDRCESAEQ